MKRIWSGVSKGGHTLVIALVVALVCSATGAVAAQLITGKDIQNGSVKAKDLSKKVRSKLNQAGTAGTAGAPGQTGPQGTAGADGAPGADGDDGAPGADGDNGDDGATGPQGPAGQNGENADGSTTLDVNQSGDGGFTIGSVIGTGAGNPNNGVATITGGNLNLKVNNPGGGFAEAGKTNATPIPLSTVTALVYKYARITPPSPGAVAPVLKLDIVDGTPCTSADAGCGNAPLFANNSSTLVYEPTYSDPANPATATADALGSGNKWWSTRDLEGAFDRDAFTPNGLVTLQSIIANNPNAKVTKVYVQAGQNSTGAPWSGFEGTVDWLNVGFGTDDVIKYDFGG